MPYGPFSQKRSLTVYFYFRLPANSKLAAKSAKRKPIDNQILFKKANKQVTKRLTTAIEDEQE